MHYVDKSLSVGCTGDGFMPFNLKCEFRKRKSNWIDCPTCKIFYFILNWLLLSKGITLLDIVKQLGYLLLFDNPGIFSRCNGWIDLPKTIKPVHWAYKRMLGNSNE